MAIPSVHAEAPDDRRVLPGRGTEADVLLFLAYGVPNAHFHRHRAYYRHLRPDLGYEDLDPDLARTLADAGLLAQPPTTAPASDGAFRPSLLQRLFARRLRS